MAERPAPPPRLARPRVLLPLVAALLLVMVLFTPRPPEQRGQLTSYSAAAGGARALHDAAARLGWTVERRTVPFRGAVDTGAVHAVLEPSVTVTAGEVHRLLEAVRAGAGLLVVAPSGSALADSLGLARSASGGTLPLAPVGLCPDSLNDLGLITWFDGRVHSWYITRHPDGVPLTTFAAVLVDSALAERDSAREAAADSARAAARADSVAARVRASLRVRAGLSPDTAIARGGGGKPMPDTTAGDDEASDDVADTADTADTADAADAAEPTLVSRPAILGFPLGRGRVVAVADPDLLRNDVLRVCRWNAGALAFRALDWLAEGRERRLAFDEFHHGRGQHADPLGAVRDALLHTPPGRATLHLAAAALLLLAAAGIRPLAPSPTTVHERRSPLEHVGALARAYEQVGATRLAARRLVRGLRRRHGLGARRAPATGDAAADPDLHFLDTVAARRPALAADARRLAHAVTDGVPRDELAAVGDAVARLDQHLRPDR